jgi:HTH domain
MAMTHAREVAATPLAAELARLAEQLEPLNGDGRSAAVWSLAGSPRLLYAGAHAQASVLEDATRRLSLGESTFEIQGELGVRGKVVVCGLEGEGAAYGLFVRGAGQPHLEATIDRLIKAAERSIGTEVAKMSRAEKQRVVRFLDEQGAFLIRRAVEDVADRLGVTRFTIYNYLDRSE